MAVAAPYAANASAAAWAWLRKASSSSKTMGSRAGRPCGRAPDCRDCSSAGVFSSASTKLRMVVPSSSQCSTLIPARPSANTIRDTALSNQRLPRSPYSSSSQASWMSAGAKSSRATQNSAVSMSSRAAALTGWPVIRDSRVAAHSARAMVVKWPAEVSASGSPPAFMTAHRPASRSSRLCGAPSGPSTSSRNIAPRKKTTMCRAGDGPGQASVYGARTESSCAPGMRVAENRKAFCTIDWGTPRCTTGSIRPWSSCLL